MPLVQQLEAKPLSGIEAVSLPVAPVAPVATVTTATTLTTSESADTSTGKNTQIPVKCYYHV